MQVQVIGNASHTFNAANPMDVDSPPTAVSILLAGPLNSTNNNPSALAGPVGSGVLTPSGVDRDLFGEAPTPQLISNTCEEGQRNLSCRRQLAVCGT